VKITIRRGTEGFEAYVPKKDLEEAVVASERPELWGGWIELGNGWRFALPPQEAEVRLPLTVDARRIATGDG